MVNHGSSCAMTFGFVNRIHRPTGSPSGRNSDANRSFHLAHGGQPVLDLSVEEAALLGGGIPGGRQPDPHGREPGGVDERRRPYRLTPAGRQHLRERLNLLDRVQRAAARREGVS